MRLRVPVGPGASLLLDLGQPAEALTEFERSQKTDPNRFLGLAGAARAAEQAGDREKARGYCSKLMALVGSEGADRPEIQRAKSVLGK